MSRTQAAASCSVLASRGVAPLMPMLPEWLGVRAFHQLRTECEPDRSVLAAQSAPSLGWFSYRSPASAKGSLALCRPNAESDRIARPCDESRRDKIH